MATGGSVQGVTLNGRYFPVDAEADASIKPSGYTNEKMVNGDGSSRNKKTRVIGGISGLVLQCDNDRNDFQFFQTLSAQTSDFDCDATLVDGTVYSGSCQIEGKFEYKTMDSTCEIEIKGTMEIQ